MRMKRLLALLLACAAIAGMLVLPSTAGAATTTAFTDIYDTNVAQAAETLRLLGIVSGTGGTAFQPDRALTRAEFCKLAVELMGNGDKVAAQMNRTVFQDVPPPAPATPPSPPPASSGVTPTATSTPTGPLPMARPSPFWSVSWAMETAMWVWSGPTAIWLRPVN